MTINQIYADTRKMECADIVGLKVKLLVEYLEYSLAKENKSSTWFENAYYIKYSFYYRWYFKIVKYWLKLPRIMQSIFLWLPDFFYYKLMNARDTLYVYVNTYTPGAYENLNALDEIFWDKVWENLGVKQAI